MDTTTVTTPTAATTKEWTKNIEICHWLASQRKWKKISNLPLCLNDESANISSVSILVSVEAFDGDPVVLLDLDYLKLLDSSASKGDLIRSIVVV